MEENNCQYVFQFFYLLAVSFLVGNETLGECWSRHGLKVYMCCVFDFQPAMPTPSLFLCQIKNSSDGYMLLRADSDASLYSWSSISEPAVRRDDHIPTIQPSVTMSMINLWKQTQPMGLLDNVVSHQYHCSVLHSFPKLVMKYSFYFICISVWCAWVLVQKTW